MTGSTEFCPRGMNKFTMPFTVPIVATVLTYIWFLNPIAPAGLQPVPTIVVVGLATWRASTTLPRHASSCEEGDVSRPGTVLPISQEGHKGLREISGALETQYRR
jgi:hypothetical protein